MTTLAVLGSYLPRRCGIATFTSDLCQNVTASVPDISCFTLAVNDTEKGYDYPEIVHFEFDEGDLGAYRRAADYLNMSGVDAVSLQHEFGIYGGPAGSHVVTFLRDLRMPVATTLHTVLHEPNADQRKVMDQISRLSDRLVVMSQRSKDMLEQIYEVPTQKIDLIHHGIPDVSFVDPNFYKDKFGVAGKLVLLTFGLLSPNKGIEYVIRAMPEIVQRYPNVVYLVLGATHPHVIREAGETYRTELEKLVADLGMEKHVIFHNRFVELAELNEFIGAADIYITPYLSEAQAVSGTLAYTVGAGKAVISTPYWYAQELLSDGRGLLVPFRDAKAIAKEVNTLLANEAERHAMRKRAYLYGRDMIWSKVATRYVETLQKARAERMREPRRLHAIRGSNGQAGGLPNVRLDHIRHMTDDTGMLQHSVFTIPRYQEGYTTDDNARALLAMVMLRRLDDLEISDLPELTARYLAFVYYAFNPETRSFRNFMSFDRHWLEDAGSEDCQGRTINALGTLLANINDPRLRGPASYLFDAALEPAEHFATTRGVADSLLGIQTYLSTQPGNRVAQRVRDALAERLLASYRDHRYTDWEWFEDSLTYDNAVLPHALLLAGEGMGRQDMVEAALRSLEWLQRMQCPEGNHFVPIGSDGFYPRSGERARFGQQPLEATATVLACLAACRATGDPCWHKEAQRAFEWFLGRNDLRLPLYDAVTGGCRDGLFADRANENEGAESSLAFIIALIAMRSFEIPGNGEIKQWTIQKQDTMSSSPATRTIQS